MKSNSPILSRLLCVYAGLFVGVAPLVLLGLLAATDVTFGWLTLLFIIALALGTFSLSVYVFFAYPSLSRVFATLVMVHYFGVIATNIMNWNSFPDESRAAIMTLPRIIRSTVIALFFGWYYFYFARCQRDVVQSRN